MIIMDISITHGEPGPVWGWVLYNPDGRTVKDRYRFGPYRFHSPTEAVTAARRICPHAEIAADTEVRW